MDTLVFDIETQNFFTDQDVGRDNFDALKISVVGVYSYAQDKYFAFEENEMAACAELFAGARTIIGFSMNRYDVPVLNHYFQQLGRTGGLGESGVRAGVGDGIDKTSGDTSVNGVAMTRGGTVKTPNLWAMNRIDLLDEIELAVRGRVSLSRLAEVNLGMKKEMHGSMAIALYRDGKIAELKEYCLNDVRLTKGLYDLSRKQNFLMIPDKKTGEIVKVEFAKFSPTPTLL